MQPASVIAVGMADPGMIATPLGIEPQLNGRKKNSFRRKTNIHDSIVEPVLNKLNAPVTNKCSSDTRVRISQSLSVWSRWLLWLAAAYDSVWGTWMLLFPASWLRATGFGPAAHPEVTQFAGMVTLTLAFGYLLASRDPIRHWPIVAIGLAGKVLAPVGFIWVVNSGTIPLTSLWTVVLTGVVWWLPFGFILTAAYSANRDLSRHFPPAVLQMALRTRTSAGSTLAELSQTSPVLLVFLRHGGCAFCRETLSDLRQQREAIEETGTTIVLTHMGNEHRIRRLLLRYQMDDTLRITDTERTLYRAFGLQRGGAAMLLSPKVWWRALEAAIVSRHGAGPVDGDARQLPGAFVLFHGEILRSYRHRSPADRPDYAALVGEESSPQVLW